MPENLGPDERIKKAKEAGVPQIYFNGFLGSIGIGDVFLIAERNGEPVAVINMSYTIAKTLTLHLGALVAQIEEKAKREILTTSDIERIFSDPETKQ